MQQAGELLNLRSEGHALIAQPGDAQQCLQIGAVRVVTMPGKAEGVLREQLLAQDDTMPFPTMDYSCLIAQPGVKALLPHNMYGAMPAHLWTRQDRITALFAWSAGFQNPGSPQLSRVHSASPAPRRCWL